MMWQLAHLEFLKKLINISVYSLEDTFEVSYQFLVDCMLLIASFTKE